MSELTVLTYDEATISVETYEEVAKAGFKFGIWIAIVLLLLALGKRRKKSK